MTNLRKQLIARLNHRLGAEVLEQIYFSKFSIQ